MITASCRLLLPINRKHFNPLNFLNTRKFVSTQDLSSKSKVEKNILPSKPKKPMNAFLIYYTSVKERLQEEYPNFKTKELLIKASEKWAQADSTLKQNFQKQYLEQASIYKQKLLDYKNSLTNDQKVEIVQDLMKKGQNLKKTEIKQTLAELGKPKRPLSAFMLFLQNKKINKEPNMSYKDFVTNMTKEWKNLSTEAKNKYIAETKDLFEKYKIEMKKWEEDMIRADQRCEPIKDSVLKEKDTLQATVKHSKTTAMDTSINNVKRTSLQHIHTQTYTYLISTWTRVLTFLKEIRENWKTKYTNP